MCCGISWAIVTCTKLEARVTSAMVPSSGHYICYSGIQHMLSAMQISRAQAWVWLLTCAGIRHPFTSLHGLLTEPNPVRALEGAGEKSSHQQIAMPPPIQVGRQGQGVKGACALSSQLYSWAHVEGEVTCPRKGGRGTTYCPHGAKGKKGPNCDSQGLPHM